MPGLIRDLTSLYQWIQDPDKDKRTAAQQMLLADPGRFQALVDSDLGNNPQALQSIFGRDARFGANSNASTNLVNSVMGAQLSPGAQAQKLQELQNTPVDSSNYADAQTSAFHGMSPQQMADAVRTAYAPVRAGTSNVPQYLNQDQQALLPGNKAGLEAQARKAQTGVDTSLTRKNVAETKEVDQRTAELATKSNADTLVTNWLKENPSFAATSPHDLFFSSNPSVPQEVKDAIPVSNKYSSAFNAQFTKNLEDQRNKTEADRIKMEKGRLAFDQNVQQNLFARQTNQLAGSAWKDSGYVAGQSGFKGFQDIYSGNPTSPEAQGVVKLAGQKAKQGMVKAYNDELNRILAESKDGKMNPDAINAALQGINQQGAGLSAFGINKEPLIYDHQRTTAGGLSGMVQGMVPDKFKQKTIQTQSGGIASPVIEDSDEVALAKHNRWNEIHKQYPALPDAAITARVEGEFKNKKQ